MLSGQSLARSCLYFVSPSRPAESWLYSNAQRTLYMCFWIILILIPINTWVTGLLTYIWKSVRHLSDMVIRTNKKSTGILYSQLFFRRFQLAQFRVNIDTIPPALSASTEGPCPILTKLVGQSCTENYPARLPDQTTPSLVSKQGFKFSHFFAVKIKILFVLG